MLLSVTFSELQLIEFILLNYFSGYREDFKDAGTIKKLSNALKFIHVKDLYTSAFNINKSIFL